MCRNRDARDSLNCPGEPTFFDRGSCNSRSASSCGRTQSTCLLWQNTCFSLSLCSEVEQNDNLCSAISAFPFTKDTARFATLRWVMDREAQRSLDSYSAPDVRSAGISADGCSGAQSWRLVFETRPRQYLFGDWGGKRTASEEKGIKVDFFYITDLQANPSGG